MKKAKEDKSLLENVLKKTLYSAGFMCAKAAKVIKMADNTQRKRTFSYINDFFATTTEKTTGLLQDIRGGTANMKKSFKKGFESVKGQIEDETGEEAEDELKAIGPEPRAEETVLINEGEEPGPEAKAVVKDTKKEDESPEESQGIKEFPEELLDAGLEKEIEEIDKEVANI